MLEAHALGVNQTAARRLIAFDASNAAYAYIECANRRPVP